MLSNELRYKVDSIEDTMVDLNGFLYHRCMITVPGNIHLPGYISEKTMNVIKVGEYYYSQKAYITSLSGDPNQAEIAFRIDYTNTSCEKKFLAEKETIVKINALMCKRSDTDIKHYGPMRVPFLCMAAKLHNELGKFFSVLVIGFHSKAKVLKELSEQCYADITGVLASRKPDKPCYIVLKDVHVRKEVK